MLSSSRRSLAGKKINTNFYYNGPVARNKHHPDGLLEYQNMSAKWIQRDTERWWLLDCTGHQLPHIASITTQYCMGQNRADFRPGIITGDQIVLINCKDVVLTGDQWIRNPVEWRTNWPGGKYRVRMSDMFNKDPCMVVWNEVRKEVDRFYRTKMNMKRAPLENVWLYETATHPHNDKGLRPLSWNPSPMQARYKGMKHRRWEPNALLQ